jgi:methionyl-tRNA synthetase
MDAYAIHEGAAAAFRLIDATNEYLAATSPWAMAKDPALANRLTEVLFDAAEAVRLAAVLLSPIMPRSANEILRRMGAAAEPLRMDADGRWRSEGERALAQEGPLWPRKETVVTDNSTTPPGAPTTSAPGTQAPSTVAPGTQAPSTVAPGTVAPGTPAPAGSARISIEDFMKVELRVAKVLAAERVPKSKKLLKVQVDVGSEQRTLVAGIAEAYEPEALVGRTVVVVFNLQPATLMGVESNGMVLAASPDGGKPILLSFDSPPAPGTRVR